MTAIVGIAAPNRKADLNLMLDRLSYRGKAAFIVPNDLVTMGILFPDNNPAVAPQPDTLEVGAGRGHFAAAQLLPGGLSLSRDDLGVEPLYYGSDSKGVLVFASEVKALTPFTRDIKELPQGARLINGVVIPRPPTFEPDLLLLPEEEIAAELLRRLTEAVAVRAQSQAGFGCLLSGGLDSTLMAALARPFTESLHTYAAGLPDAPDLLYARKAAEFLNCTHHEQVLTLDEMISLLPEVIYHLESFDALLVRSSILHYAAAKAAAGQCTALFSGEGADELFAGYDYLKALPTPQLETELVELPQRLHNTALQRVDRCIQAHGMVGWVPMLDPAVVEYARSIPTDLKLHQGVEKWILRQASAGLLPPEISHRPKAKFWQGGGVGNLLAARADELITDQDFSLERRLPNGWTLNSKEELLYFRIFKEHFGELEDLDWVGRTKGSPVQPPAL